MRESERRPLFAWLQTVDIFQWTFVFLFYQANFGWNRVRVFDFLLFFFFIKQYGCFRYVPIHRNISSDRTKSYCFFFFFENTFLVLIFWITFHLGPHFFSFLFWFQELENCFNWVTNVISLMEIAYVSHEVYSWHMECLHGH